MPEGPEYAITAKEFNDQFFDENLKVTDVNVPINKKTTSDFVSLAKNKIIGKIFVETIAHGKSLFMVFEKDNKYTILHTKFGLHGYWQINTNSEDNNPHIKIALTLDDGTILIYVDPTNFGNKYIISHKDMITELTETYDPIKEDITAEILKKLLTQGRIKSKPIAKLLLDQSVIVGIGNYLRSEILYAAKIHPETPANKIIENPNVFSALLRAINNLPVKIFEKIEKGKSESEIFKVYNRDVTPKNETISILEIEKRKCYYVKSRQKIIAN